MKSPLPLIFGLIASFAMAESSHAESMSVDTSIHAIIKHITGMKISSKAMSIRFMKMHPAFREVHADNAKKWTERIKKAPSEDEGAQQCSGLVKEKSFAVFLNHDHDTNYIKFVNKSSSLEFMTLRQREVHPYGDQPDREHHRT